MGYQKLSRVCFHHQLSIEPILCYFARSRGVMFAKVIDQCVKQNEISRNLILVVYMDLRSKSFFNTTIEEYKVNFS